MYQKVKYTFDITVALMAGVIVGPLSVFVAVLLRSSQGNVLFRQIRPGLNGKPFTLYKFCTMSEARDAHGELLPDEQRMTKIGAIVRSLSLDELPQFWNVLRGDMSLVGPRPLLIEYLSRYTPEQARRHEVKPGITGWAQVNGRNAISWERKFELDVWYVDHASFCLDLQILWKTCMRVVCRSGITSRGHATMPKFLGGKVGN